jgi:hypothetical protein
MSVTKYLERLYDSFKKGTQTSVCINSKTSVDLNSTGFRTLYLDFETAKGLQEKVDGQSGT